MRKFLFWSAVIFFAVMMVISLSMTGTQAQATPQTTSVYFKSIEKGIPQSIDLYHFTAKGRMWTQSIGKTRNNAGLVCPKNGKYSLAYGDVGSRVVEVLPAGQCLRAQGQIEVSVLRGR